MTANHLLISAPDQMTAYVSSISEMLRQNSHHKAFEGNLRLHNNCIQPIHTSLFNETTLAKMEGFFVSRIVIGLHREIQEVKNAHASYETIGPVTPYFLKSRLNPQMGLITMSTPERPTSRNQTYIKNMSKRLPDRFALTGSFSRCREVV